MNNPNRDVSGGRKALYYVGLGMVVIGFLVFISVFFTFGMGSFGMGGPSMMGSFMGRGITGMLLMIGGSLLMRVGARGVAGSGLMLDPRRTREDLEPWTRAAGGMVRDALDEADLDLDRDKAGGEIPFDEKLRRLEALRKEGLIDEAEYQAKRREILSEDW